MPIVVVDVTAAMIVTLIETAVAAGLLVLLRLQMGRTAVARAAAVQRPSSHYRAMRVLMTVRVRMRVKAVLAGRRRRRVGVVVAMMAMMAGRLALAYRCVAGRCGCDYLTLQHNDTYIIVLVRSTLDEVNVWFVSMFTGVESNLNIYTEVETQTCTEDKG